METPSRARRAEFRPRRVSLPEHHAGCRWHPARQLQPFLEAACRRRRQTREDHQARPFQRGVGSRRVIVEGDVTANTDDSAENSVEWAVLETFFPRDLPL